MWGSTRPPKTKRNTHTLHKAEPASNEDTIGLEFTVEGFRVQGYSVQGLALMVLLFSVSRA